MLINVNTIERRACETLNQVQCSHNMTSSCYTNSSSPRSAVQSFQLASARKSFEAGLDGWFIYRRKMSTLLANPRAGLLDAFTTRSMKTDWL